MYEARPEPGLQVPKYYKRHIQKERKNHYYATLNKLFLKRGIDLDADLVQRKDHLEYIRANTSVMRAAGRANSNEYQINRNKDLF
jgi:hypothetical protein